VNSVSIDCGLVSWTRVPASDHYTNSEWCACSLRMYDLPDLGPAAIPRPRKFNDPQTLV